MSAASTSSSSASVAGPWVTWAISSSENCPGPCPGGKVSAVLTLVDLRHGEVVQRAVFGTEEDLRIGIILKHADQLEFAHLQNGQECRDNLLPRLLPFKQTCEREALLTSNLFGNPRNGLRDAE